jgi:hypothetical protein
MVKQLRTNSVSHFEQSTPFSTEEEIFNEVTINEGLF